MTPVSSWHSYPSIFALGHRALTGGLPEWYKEQLMKRQFE